MPLPRRAPATRTWPPGRWDTLSLSFPPRVLPFFHSHLLLPPLSWALGGGFCIRPFPQEGEQGPDDRWAGAGFGGPRLESGARRHVWVCKQAEVSPGGKVHGKKRART